MIRRVAIVIAVAAGVCSAIPAGAEEVGVGVGPNGVTVGTLHGDRDRDRTKTVIINKDRDRAGDRGKTIIINKDRNRDRDHDRRSVVIEHN